MAEDAILERRHRRLLYLSAVAYTTFYIGAFFGWGPMQLLVRGKAHSTECTA